MPVQCILCAQEAQLIGVGECNHEPMCFRCVYKMRVISKNNQCPICKLPLKNIIVMPHFAPYHTFKHGLLPDKHFADVFFTSEEGRAAFEKLTEYKCFVRVEGKPCKLDKKFPSVAFLKKHLREDHNRYICEICVEKKTCVLQEQKLYTFKALGKHMDKGDVDEFGNVTFMHPFCAFCSRHFFDEEEFRRHVNVEHMLCNVCGKQEKYRYYKHYDSLEVHYKMSHYICNDENCLAKKFIAFKNAEELRLHRLQIHDRNYAAKKIDIKELCGFQYEGHNPDDEVILIKDKEGVDMEDQFLNLKKCKNKALGEADQHSDVLLDPRLFYECPLEEEEHFEEAFILKHRRQEERPNTNHKKKKYIEKTELEKEKPIIAKEDEQFYFEELTLIPFTHSKLPYEDFEAKLKNLLTSEDVAKFNALRAKMNKRQIKPPEFLEEFLKLMRSVSLKSAYLVFPHFVRTVTNDELKEDLNFSFVRALKALPSKTQSLLSKCGDYSDLFRALLREVEASLEERIRRKELSIKKPVKRCKERLFQIIGVVRRLKIEEMAKFKFATNFGIHKDTADFIVNSIYKGSAGEAQALLGKIQREELLDCYVFVKLCYQAIKHSKNLVQEKNKIHENILEDFLYERPHLEQQFGLKKEELKNLEEQVEYEKLQEERRVKHTLKEIEKKNERQGYKAKTDFNLVDKGDFPDLDLERKEEAKKEDNLREVIQIVKEKPATYQKKINEMFPTLGDDSPSKQEKARVEPQKEKAWWEKINEGKKVEIEEEEEEKVRVRKGKKKEKWVSVKGLFN